MWFVTEISFKIIEQPKIMSTMQSKELHRRQWQLNENVKETNIKFLTKWRCTKFMTGLMQYSDIIWSLNVRSHRLNAYVYSYEHIYIVYFTTVSEI